MLLWYSQFGVMLSLRAFSCYARIRKSTDFPQIENFFSKIFSRSLEKSFWPISWSMGYDALSQQKQTLPFRFRIIFTAKTSSST